MSKIIEVELPKGFMNVGVTSDNSFLTANTNDSANWDTLKFPLPKGKWRIKGYSVNITDGVDNGKPILQLIDSRSVISRFLDI